MKKSLEIMSAQHGGYVVVNANNPPGYSSNILFAGILDACLEFIGSFMTGAYEQS